MKQDRLSDSEMKQIREHGQQLQTQAHARNELFDKMQGMFLLDRTLLDLKKESPDVKETLSPSARVGLIGALRLLIATEPTFQVKTRLAENASSQEKEIEKLCSLIFEASCRMRGFPIHYDMLLSALLFSRADAVVRSTAEMLDHVKNGGSKAEIKRMEKIASATPFLITPLNPRFGYPEWGDSGLAAYYTERQVPIGAIYDKFPHFVKVLDKPRSYAVTYCEFVDMKHHAIWLAELKDEPLVAREHEWPCIPFVCQLVEGSMLFSKPEEQHQPFLYTLYKTGLWQRESLMLTVWFTLYFVLGANPKLVAILKDRNQDLEIDDRVLGQLIRLQQGESITQLFQQVIDPQSMQLFNQLGQMVSESTIYRQALGEPVGAQAPYSLQALLSQAGRLPLVSSQRLGGWALSSAMDICMDFLRDRAYGGTFEFGDKQVKVDPSLLPDTLMIEATLDIALPQDALQQATVAARLIEGPSPVASRRYVREEVMKIPSSREMQWEIWNEKASEVMFELFMQQMAQRAMQPPPQPPPQAPQAGAAPGAPSPGSPTGEGPMGTPMEVTAGPTGAAVPGQPEASL